MHHSVSASEKKDKIPLTYRRKDPVYDWSILNLMDERITPIYPISAVAVEYNVNNIILASVQ